MQYLRRQDFPPLPSLPSLSLPSLSVPASSDASSDPTSEPTSAPPSSVETTPPPTSIPTSIPRSSDITSIPTSSNSTIVPSTTNDVPSTTPPPPPPFIPTPTPSTTENVTTIVTVISDQLTTFTSVLPTSLVDSTPDQSSSRRTAVIAGSTAGLFALLLIFLGAVFFWRRHRLRKSLQDSSKKKEVRALLDGEEFDDDDRLPMSMRQNHEPSSPYQRSVSPNPSLLKSRTSETGSIFREEVWPPPGFVDPILKQNSQVDLSKIVDEVMGPTASGSSSNGDHHSTSSTSHQRDLTYATMSSVRSDLSTNSSTPLMPTSFSDPFQPSNSTPSIHNYSLPPGALAPTAPGSSSRSPPPSTVKSRGVSSPTTEEALHARSTSAQLRNSQPAKSSPLARALSGDARIFLGRSPGEPSTRRR